MLALARVIAIEVVKHGWVLDLFRGICLRSVCGLFDNLGLVTVENKIKLCTGMTSSVWPKQLEAGGCHY